MSMANERIRAHEGAAHPLALTPTASGMGSGLYSEDVEQVCASSEVCAR